MFFGFGRGKKTAVRPPVDPLAAFDALLEELEDQARDVRKSAATLLTARAELRRSVERYERMLKELTARQRLAKSRHDARAFGVLERDRAVAERQRDASHAALAQIEVDAELLTATAERLRGQTEDLRLERTSASARLVSGRAVYDSLREQADRFKHAVQLDAARDEIEKAHALADIYRDET